jgi:hypothetical protein
LEFEVLEFEVLEFEVHRVLEGSGAIIAPIGGAAMSDFQPVICRIAIGSITRS